MTSLPKLPDSFSITLTINEVPTEFLLRVQSRTSTEVRYRAEVTYECDGDEETAVVAVRAYLSGGELEVGVNFPMSVPHHSHEIRKWVWQGLGLPAKK